jgi:hypothetical protein
MRAAPSVLAAGEGGGSVGAGAGGGAVAAAAAAAQLEVLLKHQALRRVILF